MDLFELSKKLGNNIHIIYNQQSDLFVSKLDGVCTPSMPMSKIYGVGRNRKDSLISLVQNIKGIILYGEKDTVKVPKDLKLPTGL